MPAEREPFRRAHRSQVVLAGFDDDAAGSAQRARAADVHEADSIFHRGAEQGAAASHLDLSPVEFDRHDVGARGHLLEPGSECVTHSAIITARGVSIADFSLAANSDSL